MSSNVFYRFKAQKEASTVHFEGTGISVWDLKKEILAENKLGKGTDFDFAIYNADTNEEYSDDKAIVPRSTSVIARRLPPNRPGRGNAQYYMVSSSTPSTSTSHTTGPGAARTLQPAGSRGHFTKRFDGREESPQKASTPSAPIVAPGGATGTEEAARIAAMFATTSEQWKTTQEKMSSATPVYNGPRRTGGAPGGMRPGNNSIAPDKPVPAGYVCYRCGQSGHWIQDCPTNNDPDFKDKPRMKRTTGIPKSFLTTVEGPSKDGENQAGLMISSDGGFVVARPDAASWEKHRAITANLSSTDIQEMAPTDPDLTCPLCNRLLRDATKTPCCGKSYCEECVQNYLSENDFVCRECESKIKSLKQLVKDEDRRERAKKYLDDTLKKSKALGDKEKGDGSSGTDDEKESVDGKDASTRPTVKIEDAGPPEEGEVDGDENGRSVSPANQTRAGSVARSDAGMSRQGSSAPTAAGVAGNGNTHNGMNGNMNAMMNNASQMANAFQNNTQQQMATTGGVPPQMQMLQGQIQQTMNILSSNTLAPHMRMQLSAQLQNLQMQLSQMAQMMSGGGGGMTPQQQMMMQQLQSMQQMQYMQQMMMRQQQFNNPMMMQNHNGVMMGGGSGFSSNVGQPQANPSAAMGGRHGAQYAESSPDSPYMRVPINEKFRQAGGGTGLKRGRPDEEYASMGMMQGMPGRRM